MAALVMLCVAAGMLLDLRTFRRELRSDAAGDLVAVAEVKAAEVARWREERLSDGRAIATSGLVARAARLAQRGSAAARADLAAWCAATAAKHDEYTAAVVFDARGERLVSVGRAADAVPPGEHGAWVGREAKAALSELHRDERGDIHLDVVAPLPPADADGSFVGHVVLRVDPSWHLVPAVQVWPGRRDTGEAMLIQPGDGPDGGPLVIATGHRGTEVLRDPVGSPLAAAATTGVAEPVEGLDHHGHLVLAAVRPVPRSTLSVIAKLDVSEIEEPLRERAAWLLVLGLAVVVAVVSATHVWWRRQVDVFRWAQHEGELRRLALERHFGYVTRHASEALLLFDGRLRVVEANDRALEMYGHAREDLLGMHARDLLAPRARPRLEERLLSIAAKPAAVFETWHRRGDGAEFPVEVNTRAIEVEGERYRQCIVRDLTRQKESVRALRASEERLQLVAEVSGLGVWGWSARDDDLYVSATALGQLGRGREELRGGRAIWRALHPSDRAAVSARLRATRDGTRPMIEVEVRLRRGSGEWLRVLSRTRVLQRDAAGRPARVAGTITPIAQEAGSADGAGAPGAPSR